MPTALRSGSSSNTRTLTLPRPHEAQRGIISAARRFNVVPCGRRFGKTVLGCDRIIRPALEGYPVGWFAPTYKILLDGWRDVARYCAPVAKRINQSEHRIELLTGGTLEAWSLEDPNAGRSRKYARVIVDEAGLVKKLEEAWNESIRPTLSDYRGDAWFLGTPKGMNFFWQLFMRCQDDTEAEWHGAQAPTSANPFIHPEEIEAARRELPERVFQQEYLAEFLEDAGGVFRKVRDAIDKGRSENEARQPDRKHFLGLDLARVEDFTVLAVVDETGRQVYFERFNQISWERQKSAVIRVAREYDADVWLDSTGVGDPIYEDLRKSGIRCRGFTFTNASKEALIDNLAIRIEQGDARLMDVTVQTNELLAFQYELTPSRNIRMGAPEGMHDDCVIGLALAYWGINKRREMEFF